MSLTIKMQKDIIREVDKLIKPFAGRCWIEIPTQCKAKHPRLMFEINGKTYVSVMAGSPHRPDKQVMYKRLDVKRMLKEIGLIK